MTYYYFYHPKPWIDPAWIEALADEAKRKRHGPIISTALELVEKTLPKDKVIKRQATPELEAKMSEFIGYSKHIAKLEQQIREIELEEGALNEILSLQAKIVSQRQIIAARLLEMEEEEAAMLLLLMF